MAANGYIVVAPNRRGMPGHGVEWNEQISKDWGGKSWTTTYQPMISKLC
jgi:dipeptidyl aminopeptidase/acylaminoacyl peptidase